MCVYVYVRPRSCGCCPRPHCQGSCRHPHPHPYTQSQSQAQAQDHVREGKGGTYAMPRVPVGFTPSPLPVPPGAPTLLPTTTAHWPHILYTRAPGTCPPMPVYPTHRGNVRLVPIADLGGKRQYPGPTRRSPPGPLHVGGVRPQAWLLHAIGG